jgi:hypothetical protein
LILPEERKNQKKEKRKEKRKRKRRKPYLFGWLGSIGERRWKLGRRWETARDRHRCRKLGRSTPEWGKWVGGVDSQRMQVGAGKWGRTAGTEEMGCRTWWREIFGLARLGGILALRGK